MRADERPGQPRWVKRFTAGSLEEYFEIIHTINEFEQVERGEKGDDIYSLWYRGHAYSHYTLLPTLFRAREDSADMKKDEGYSGSHLQEDYRYHHFKAKVNQLIDTFPKTKIEWQELMQHHLASTRLMDWTESAISSLMFAIEPFINPGNDKDLEYKRASITPVIWVMNPKTCNKRIYELLGGGDDRGAELIRKAVEDVCPYDMTEAEKMSFARALGRSLKEKKEEFFSGKGSAGRYRINQIVCLSAIVEDRNDNQARMFRLLQSGEFNPFFYLLSRYYADGVKVPAETLPPLATVHPYHSARIQAQHGVFMVVPHYYFDERQARLYELGIDTRAAENQFRIRDCLYEVQITHPARVARDLLLAGERRSSIYPELENYAKDIEAMQYYV